MTLGLVVCSLARRWIVELHVVSVCEELLLYSTYLATVGRFEFVLQI
jgi:hypothetical protein